MNIGKDFNKHLNKDLKRGFISRRKGYNFEKSLFTQQTLQAPIQAEVQLPKLNHINELAAMLPDGCWKIIPNKVENRVIWDLYLYQEPIWTGKNITYKEWFGGSTVDEVLSKCLEYLVSKENYNISS